MKVIAVSKTLSFVSLTLFLATVGCTAKKFTPTSQFPSGSYGGSTQSPHGYSVTPTSGPIAGGTSITISGTNFHNVTEVTLGGIACNIVRQSEWAITCTTGAYPNPTSEYNYVDILITQGDGQTSTATSQYQYLIPEPSIIDVIPSSGSTAGDYPITLLGLDFMPGATVQIGNRTCTDVQVISSTEIQCTAPTGHSGSTNVTVSNPHYRSATRSSGFRYTIEDAPQMAIADTYFNNLFRNFPVTPPLSVPVQQPVLGNLDVVVADPDEGTRLGGTHIQLVVDGINRFSPVTVTIGGVPCRDPYYDRYANTVSCLTGPSDHDGTVDIVVTNAGRSARLDSGFHYLAEAAAPAPQDHPLQVILVEPQTGPARGRTPIELTVQGLQPGTTTVSIGGNPCTRVVPDVANFTIYCHTPAHSGGAVDIVVHNNGRPYTLRDGFTYTGQVAAPVTPVSTTGIPHATFRPFPGSEAEALYRGRQVRLTSRHSTPTVILGYEDRWPENGWNWVARLEIGGQMIGISNSDIPRSQSEAYVIESAELAEQVGLHVGDSLSQEQIMEHEHADVLQIAFEDPTQLSVNREAMNPAYNQRPTTPAEQAYLDYIRAQIQARIESRNAQHGQEYTVGGRRIRWYTGPSSYNGTLYVNPDFARGHQYDSNQFSALMTAIQNNTEAAAIESIVNLATNFDYNHAEPKAGFIDTFSYLFVTKQFPSEGARQSYLHYVLRCGHIE